ncbi:MAG: AAA family ATPase [Caldilineaceae bacterium]
MNYPDQFRFEFYGNLRSDLARQDSSQNSPSSSDLYLMTNFLEQIERIKQRFRSNGFRGLIDEKQALGARVKSQALQLVIEKIEKILHGNYQHDDQGEKIYYDVNSYVYLNNAPSGQQEVIRILQDAFLIILDNESAFRVIEEPEAHLYPLAQKQLMEVLALVLNSTDSQFIITTHSPYILSIVNNLLFATRVAKMNPLATDEVESVIPKLSWIDPQKRMSTSYEMVILNLSSICLPG